MNTLFRIILLLLSLFTFALNSSFADTANTPGFSIRSVRDHGEQAENFQQMAFDHRFGSETLWVSREILLDENDLLSIELVSLEGVFSQTVDGLKKRSQQGGGNKSIENPARKQIYEVHIRLNPKGSKKFETVTRTHVGKRLAITLNDRVLLSPSVMESIVSGLIILKITNSKDQAEKLASELKELL